MEGKSIEKEKLHCHNKQPNQPNKHLIILEITFLKVYSEQLSQSFAGISPGFQNIQPGGETSDWVVSVSYKRERLFPRRNKRFTDTITNP